ncbi:hypothetical protein NC652_032923 [Populus alba x Populus x berolinensis]|nr:hypothetical protein NC652_032923 [Populus alba x Populus x berolinensis]
MNKPRLVTLDSACYQALSDPLAIRKSSTFEHLIQALQVTKREQLQSTAYLVSAIVIPRLK